MSARMTGWLAAALAMLVTLGLIVDEINDAGQRRWWESHSLTTDTVSGLLVLLITILVVNQLISLRQARQRSHAVASQAAIVAAQAALSVKAVSSVTSGSGDRDAASEGFRTYMVMLLISAPVFIQDPVARRFLEQAQYLGGVMTRTLQQTQKSADDSAADDSAADGSAAAGAGDGLNDAMNQLQNAAAPLLQLLSPDVRDSIQQIGLSSDG
jgi:hypothetical protein